MKTRTVTERIGEDMGPVDWFYNFRQHFDNYCIDDTGKQQLCDLAVATLREMAEGIERGESWEATTDGGWPRMCWGRVIAVRMYDGWPYWRPVPSVLTSGPLGPEWHPFHSITGANRLPREDSAEPKAI